MPYILKYFVTLIALLLTLINVSSVCARVDYTFSDKFDNISSDFSDWITIDGHPIPLIETISGRTISTLNNSTPTSFSYIGHKSSDKKVVNLSFDFYGGSGAPTQGAGFMLTDKVPEYSQRPPNDFDYYTFGIWNIGDKYYLLSPLCDYYGGCGLSVYSRAIYEVPRNTWNTISLIFNQDTVILKMNDLEREFHHDGTNLPNGVFFGNSVLATNPQVWKSFSIDNFTISYGDPLDNVVSSFPYYSQRDPAWRDLPYDNASVWAGAEANSIERWGCAITSVAMILKEYEVKMPNGDVANPDKLNTWLSTQPDGYIGNGLLNWLAISRLARVSRAAGNSPTDLEFVKSYGSAVDEIESGEYPIVNEGGHFITLFDHDETNYMINDPLDESRKTKAKTDLLVSVNTYTPSDTDLSYLMIVGEPNTELELLLSGASVGSSYTESIHDDVGGSATTSAKVVMLPKPADGSYRLNVNNPDSAGSQFKVYAYNTLGEVHILDQSAPSGDSSWNLVYKSNGSDPLITPLDTTPPEYVNTNTFSGWYKTAQTATFMFSDPNLPTDFVPPTCVISREGKNQTCTITTQVCDSLNNCKSYTLKSNPANIDLTPPKVPKHVWGHGLWPMSLIYWSEVSDATEYRIEWGKSPTQLTNSLKTKHQHVWIATNKYQKLYVRVIAIDRAGNESVGSKKMEIPVWRGHWRFW